MFHKQKETKKEQKFLPHQFIFDGLEWHWTDVTFFPQCGELFSKNVDHFADGDPRAAVAIFWHQTGALVVKGLKNHAKSREAVFWERLRPFCPQAQPVAVAMVGISCEGEARNCQFSFWVISRKKPGIE